MRALEFPENGAVAIFGGSGGAGSAICRAFAEAGCDVAFPWHSNGEKARDIERELAALAKARAYRLDLADAVLIMASKQAGYITGQCLLVDGGMSL